MNRCLVLYLLIGISISLAYSQYNYQEPNPDWGRICQIGTKQSPIDFPGTFSSYNRTRVFKVLSIHYGKLGDGMIDTVLSVHNNSYLIGNTTDWGYALIEKNNVTYKYDLVNFHVHINSEHTFDGISADIELHLVHIKDEQWLRDNRIVDQDPTKNITVFGTMFKVGSLSDDQNLNNLQVNNIGTLVKNWNISVYAPIRKPFVFYEGSLTTPNCRETVNWVIKTDVVMISSNQYSDWLRWLRTAYPNQFNNRATQPINQRQIYYQYYPNQTFGINGKTSIMLKPMIILIVLVILFI